MKLAGAIVAAAVAACYALVLADQWVNRDVHEARRIHGPDFFDARDVVPPPLSSFLSPDRE
jgi:hypothetical protein